MAGKRGQNLKGIIVLWVTVVLPVVMVNERTYYKANIAGIHRTTDGGTSWHIFMNGVIGTRIVDLVALDNGLYAHTGYDVYQSTDAGVSWEKLWNHEREAVLQHPHDQDNFRAKTDTCWRHSLFACGSRNWSRQCGYFPFING